jgi:hypothetical protein
LVSSLLHLMRIHEWRIHYVHFEQTVMIRVVQRQHDGPCQRLAWDPWITGLGISLSDGDECIFAGGSHFDFPTSFSIGGSTSIVGDWLRSCSTSLCKITCSVGGGHVRVGMVLEDRLISG